MTAFITPTPLILSNTSSSYRRANLPLVCTATTPHTSFTTTNKSSSNHTNQFHRLVQSLQHVEYLTRPEKMANESRFHSLPPHVKTDSQMLGRLSSGCEGTNSVFPRCNFSCHPCYHSVDANKVRVDGMHTVIEIAKQMKTLKSLRGQTGHCQLIGGEVSLLPVEDHILALETMRFFGRIPMSFTHGDFSYDYLKRLAVDQNTKKPRFSRLDFAVHFDIGMKGRKGIPIGGFTEERQLTPHRQKFVDMFLKLKKDYGVNFYLAHNMTVTTTNIHTISDCIMDLVGLGFRLISFQPAALQGVRRVNSMHKNFDIDDHGESVWKEIENGMGMRLSYSLFQMGDVRCNRMSVCGVLPKKPTHVFAFFDDQCEKDVHVRNILIKRIGNIVLKPWMLGLKLTRVILQRPWLIIPALLWIFRIVHRAGGLLNVLKYGGIRPLTVVMHRFMDDNDVRIAWDLMERGVDSNDRQVIVQHGLDNGKRIKETMERLQACSYGMAHPEEDRIVPACVQHSVYDPDVNVRLSKELPLNEAARSASEIDGVTM